MTPRHLCRLRPPSEDTSAAPRHSHGRRGLRGRLLRPFDSAGRTPSTCPRLPPAPAPLTLVALPLLLCLLLASLATEAARGSGATAGAGGGATATAAAAAAAMLPARTSRRTAAAFALRRAAVPSVPRGSRAALLTIRQQRRRGMWWLESEAATLGISSQIDSPKSVVGVTAGDFRRRRPTFLSAHPSSSSVEHAASASAVSSVSRDGSATACDDNEGLFAELSSLSALIRRHDLLYYTSQPEITDENYDALCRREEEICAARPDLLQQLEAETGLGSRATRFGGRVGPILDGGVGGKEESENLAAESRQLKGAAPAVKAAFDPPSAREKRMHLCGSPMLSLDNAMGDGEVTAWLNRARKLLLRSSGVSAGKVDDGEEEDGMSASGALPASVEVLAEPKLDGLSLSLRYRLRETKGGWAEYDFSWASTRGDGTRGEDVTEAVQAMDGTWVPASFRLPARDAAPGVAQPEDVEVRGEVVLPRSSFERLRSEDAEGDAADSGGDGLSDAAADVGAAMKATNSPRSRNHFSNARNAAAGILLRSKDDAAEEDVADTRALRSELRFYAYDIAPAAVLVPEAGEEARSVRDLLGEMGFSAACPSATVSVPLLGEREVGRADIHDLLRYHERTMSSRPEASGDAGRGMKNPTAETIDYEVDGSVYKLVSPSLRSVLGSSARAPRWAIAHKFPPQTAVTRIRDVEVQVGRTGALTPVAILDPIEIGGVVVARASLHNFWYATKVLSEVSHLEATAAASSRDVSGDPGFRSGAPVLVSRAGDVIPQVLRRVEISVRNDEGGLRESDQGAEGDGEWVSLSPPLLCPACGHATAFEPVSWRAGGKSATATDAIEADAEADEDEDEDEESADEAGQVLRCGGPQLLCPPRAVGALAHAFSRLGLDVRGLSEARLRQLTEAGLMAAPADLFQILDDDGVEHGDGANANGSSGDDDGGGSRPPSPMLDQISALPGWGSKSATNLANAARTVASEGVPLSRFIYSLGIRHVGAHTSKLLAAFFGSAEKFLEVVGRVANASAQSDLKEHSFDAPASEGRGLAAGAGDVVSDGAEMGKALSASFSLLVNGDVVKGIGPVTVEALTAFAKEDALVDAAKRLAAVVPVRDDPSILSSRSSGVLADEVGSQSSGPLNGMAVVFTGSLRGFTRTAAQEAAKEMGARSTPGSVSSSTDLVVAGEKGGKKADKASKLGVQVMDGEMFVRLYNRHRSHH